MQVIIRKPVTNKLKQVISFDLEMNKTIMKTTQPHLGRNLAMTSPSPVPAAAPTSLSTYDPAPGMGVSPTRLKTKYSGITSVILRVSVNNYSGHEVSGSSVRNHSTTPKMLKIANGSMLYSRELKKDNKRGGS